MDFDRIPDRKAPPQRAEDSRDAERGGAGRYAAASAAFKRGLKVPELA